MKQILILGGLASDKSPQTPYAETLNQSMPSYHFTETRFDQLVVKIAPDNFQIRDIQSNKDISDYDLVILRGTIRKNSEMAYVTSRYLKQKHVQFFNDYSMYWPSSKLAQAVLFYESKAPFLATYYSQDTDQLRKLSEAELDYPIIIKDNYGSHGLRNYLVNSNAQFSDVMGANSGLEFISQKFCPNDYDYRILIMGGKKPLQIKRTRSTDTHLNNTSQGGAAELVEDLPQSIIQLAQQLATELKMTTAGVDVLKDNGTGQFYFLEINSQPQIISGAFMSEKQNELADLLNGLLQ